MRTARRTRPHTPGAARAARRAVPPRAAGADGSLRARAERGPLGAGLRGPRDLRRLRRPSWPSGRKGARRRRALVAAPPVRERAARARVGGQARAAVPAAVRDRLPRTADPRAALPAVARSSADLSEDGSAGRAARRPVRAGLLGRAIRPAGSGGRGARGAEGAQG